MSISKKNYIIVIFRRGGGGGPDPLFLPHLDPRIKDIRSRVNTSYLVKQQSTQERDKP